jgi:hypothetical protein
MRVGFGSTSVKSGRVLLRPKGQLGLEGGDERDEELGWRW